MSIRKLILGTTLLLVIAGFASAQDLSGASAITRGNRLVAQGHYKPAIKEYERISSSDDAYAQAVFNIGVCYYELWRTDDAIEFYKRAVELRHGHYPNASYALGVALEDQNKLSGAKDAYSQAIKASANNNGPASYRLGVIWAIEGKVETAAKFFRAASSRSGEHTPASHNNLGVMLARMGRLKEAEKEFSIALRETGGAFRDAAHNLTLCRTLMLTARNRNEFDALKLSIVR
ncbi:MAG TPA: tetratricopeptide repeat protein [Pyrinomonadaceae bacterium]|nr:tetratricopeptide repeat protein [Pyrinomonadaceae bacterium]